MAEELGLRVKLKLGLDKSEVSRVTQQAQQDFKKSLNASLKIGNVEMPQFVQDLKASLSSRSLQHGIGSAGGLGNLFGKGAEGLIGKLAGMTIILEGIKDMAKAMVDRLAEASPLLRAQLSRMDMAMNLFLKPLGDAVGRMIAPMVKSMMEFQRKSNPILKKAEEEHGVVGVALATIGLGAAMIVGETMKLIRDWNVGWMTLVYDSLIEFGNRVWEGLLDVKDKLFETFPLLGDLANWIWDTATNAMVEGFKLLQDLGQWIWDTVTGMISDAGGVLGDLGQGAGDLAGKIGNVFGGWFADGGVFNQPTLIGVGEAGPEAVVPLDQLGNYGTGSVSVNLSVGTVNGVDDLRRTVFDLMDEYYASRGIRG